MVLAADSQMRSTIETLLKHRRQSLNLSATFVADVLSHPNQDPGCRTDAGSMVDPRRGNYEKAMVIFDFDGCGETRLSASELEIQLESQFENQGWAQDQIAFIAVDPELEVWLFGGSFRHIERSTSWSQSESLKDWLLERGHLHPEYVKPPDPKTAMEAVLYRQKMPRSARLYEDLARNVGLARCQDRAFQKFRSTLQRWFPAQ